jgi:hypothetical protein
MKKGLFTLLIPTLLFGCYQKKSDKKITMFSGIHYNDLTPQDRKNFKLIVKIKNTDFDACGNQTAYKITVTLRNGATDTLAYVDYTCSHLIWTTDSDLIWADEQNPYCLICTSNRFNLFQIPPNEEKQFELMAGFEKDVKPTPTKFKVGMIIQKVLNFKDMLFYFKKFDADSIGGGLSEQTQNIIWSNEITIQ